MPREFQGPRTAIVTGGARRIGAALCRALCDDGWHLLIQCNKSRAEAEALATELGNCGVVSAELADSDSAERIFRALEGLPPPRLLVNNASRFSFDSADGFSVEDWDLHLDINLRAPALLSRAFAAQAQGGGLIVNLLDAKLAQPNPDFFTYTVSKLGLAGLTELCARAWAERGIRVCGIAPSVTLVSGAQSGDNFEKVHSLNALGRGVAVEEIVSALRFLIGTPTITGQVVTLDGGQRFLGLQRDVQFLEPNDG
ncbi:MAG TPA: SDR family NAD(P)-dependent oxidoreductase [Allosphingosinicella sp.]|jgi:NAD(P)-dependent dehydrogenase (short-subunit alcohol dehydrogenase family)